MTPKVKLPTDRRRDLTESPALIAELERERIRLPLSGVDCRFHVTGAIALVEITQVFNQTANKALNCMYQFPLPGDAAVHRCEITVNDRAMVAKVIGLEAARKLYEEKASAGHRAGIIECVRPNLFTLSLGNIQPEDLIFVQLAYFQTIERSLNLCSLSIPFCPGIRYIPGQWLREKEGTDQVPDAMRMISPRINQSDPDAACLQIEGILDLLDPANLKSPSHALSVSRRSGATQIALDPKREDVPDRDFVLRWEYSEPEQPQATGCWTKRNGDYYALLDLRAPTRFDRNEQMAKTVYFLVDRSGSMEGVKWEKTLEALQGFIQVLGAKDRIHLTLFNDSAEELFPTPLTREELLERSFLDKLSRCRADGGTELLPAARRVLRLVGQHPDPATTCVILITDGQVGNEAAALEAFKSHANVVLHAFGIDTAINEAFLKSLARQQRGTCTLCTPGDDIAGIVTVLGDRIRRPVLTDLKLPTGVEPAEPNLPVLYSGDDLLLPMKLKQPMASLTVAGLLPDRRPYQTVVTLEEVDNQAVPLFWAKQRIGHLLEENQSREAVQLSEQMNIPCSLTAFVAWDEQEKVPVAHVQVFQPNLHPAQWETGITEGFLLKSLGPRPGFLPASSLNIMECLIVEDHLCLGAAADETKVAEAGQYEAGRAAAPPEIPLFERWEEDLTEFEQFQNPVGQDLIKAIKAWAREKEFVLRRAQMLELIASLQTVADDIDLIKSALRKFNQWRMGNNPTIAQLIDQLDV